MDMEKEVLDIYHELPLSDAFIRGCGDLEGGRLPADDGVRDDLHSAHLHRIIPPLPAVLDVGGRGGGREEEEGEQRRGEEDGEAAVVGRHRCRCQSSACRDSRGLEDSQVDTTRRDATRTQIIRSQVRAEMLMDAAFSCLPMGLLMGLVAQVYSLPINS